MRWTSIVTVILVAGSLAMVSSSANNSTGSNTLENNPYLSMTSQLHARSETSSSSSTSFFQPRLWDFPPPTPGSNLFNTSLAFTIVMFTLNTNAFTGTGFSRSFCDDAAAYGSSMGLSPAESEAAVTLAIPVLIAGIHILIFDSFSRPFLSGANPLSARASDSIVSRGFSRVVDYLLTVVENSLDRVPSIDGEECIKRSVCEAHSHPKKYGTVALFLQLLFLPYPYSATHATSKIFKYQLAARYGKKEKANCEAQYNGCVINPLGLINSFHRVMQTSAASSSTSSSSARSSSTGVFQPRVWEFPDDAAGANLFNTSFALTIPLFSVNSQALTGSARSLLDGSSVNYVGAYGSSLGLPPIGSEVTAALAIPVLIAGLHIHLFDSFSRPFLSGVNLLSARASDSIFSRGFSRMAEYLLTVVEKSLDRVPTIDGEECIKRSVCEAHNNPKKYGIIARPLQLLFPPYPHSGTNGTTKISKYRLAARYGKNDNANCGAQYSGCVISLLDLLNTFARMNTGFR